MDGNIAIYGVGTQEIAIAECGNCTAGQCCFFGWLKSVFCRSNLLLNSWLEQQRFRGVFVWMLAMAITALDSDLKQDSLLKSLASSERGLNLMCEIAGNGKVNGLWNLINGTGIFSLTPVQAKDKRFSSKYRVVRRAKRRANSSFGRLLLRSAKPLQVHIISELSKSLTNALYVF